MTKPQPSRPVGRTTVGVLGSALLCSLPLMAAAQDSPDHERAPESLEVQVGQRSAAISADAALDPATRDAALGRLQEAQRLLQAAAEDRAEAARLAAEQQATPTTLAELARRESEPEAADESATWSSLSLAQLEIASSEAASLARAAKERAAQSRQELADLRNRRPLIGAQLATARQAVDDAHREINQITAAGREVADTGSEEILAQARARASEARLALLEEQRSGADLREQLLEAQANAAEREGAARLASQRGLREELTRRRLSETVAQSSEWRESVVGEYEAIAAIARSNGELAGQYAGPRAVFHRLDAVQRDVEQLERSISDFANGAAALRARLDGLGRSHAAGLLIAQGLDDLPSIAVHRESLDRRHASINDLQLRILPLVRETRQLERDLPAESARIVSGLPGLPAADQDEAVRVVGRLLEARLRVLQSLLHDTDQYLGSLVEMQARETTFLSDIRKMERFLRTREAWVRNDPRVTYSDLPAAIDGLIALPSAQRWAGGGGALEAAVTVAPGRAGWVLMMVLAAVATLHGRRRRSSQHAPGTGHMTPAAVIVRALLTGLACATIPVALGWWLAGIHAAPAGIRALGTALIEIGVVVFVAGLLAGLYARQGGVASVNVALGTSAQRVRVALWYLAGVLILLVATRVLLATDSPSASAAARLCMLMSAVLIAAGLHRALVPRLLESAGRAGERWSLVSVSLHALALAIPVGFVALLVHGFTLAAFELTRALITTLLVLVIAGTVRALLLSSSPSTETDNVSWFSLRHGRADLLHVVLTLAAAGVLFWAWRDVIEALGYLQDIPLWTTETVEGLKTVTLANLLSCLAVLGGTLLTFWALPLIFTSDSEDATQRAIGTRYAIVALVRYAVLFVGVVVAFSLLNIGWSKLQWMAAGLSVGLGFGLQETAANFVSGLTLLSERSVRVGDTVTVGDKTGVVTRIRVRATSLRDFDGREIVIPNKEMVTREVTNWTLVDTKRRLQVAVGVDYGSDTALVEQTLVEAARAVGGVLSEPPPWAVFEQFGDSALQFRLFVWIDNPGDAVQINHDLHVRINQLLAERGIRIAFPQRDVRLIPAAPLEVRLRSDADEDAESAASSSDSRASPRTTDTRDTGTTQGRRR